MSEVLTVALWLPPAELLECARSLSSRTARRVLVALVHQARGKGHVQTTHRELELAVRCSPVALQRALVVIRRLHARPRAQPMTLGYPPCPKCGRPLLPHVDGALCCVGCSRLVDVPHEALWRARAAAEAEGLAPLCGAFLAPWRASPDDAEDAS